MEDVTERWLPVVGWEGLYEVSDLGHVRSLARRTPGGIRGGRTLRLAVARNGYLCVSLWKLGVGTTRTVHTLVTEAFIGPRPEGHQVRHLDGNRAHPELSNLAYGTPAENSADMKVHGTNRNAAKTVCRHGHEYTPANTKVRADGGRVCRECRRRISLDWWKRQRAKTA